MDNMWIYEQARDCPPEALKTIQAGKLRGKSDINPMWRIKKLTELFGPCGIGWKTFEETFWTTPGAGGEVIAWCSLKLCYWDKNTGEWSNPVFGIGGSILVDTQKGNLVSNDEAFKMAHTDAISVACKALGFAANVYWERDCTKYNRGEKQPPAPPAPAPVPPAHICSRCRKPITSMINNGKTYSVEEIAEIAKKIYGDAFCWECMKKVKAERAAVVAAGDST